MNRRLFAVAVVILTLTASLAFGSETTNAAVQSVPVTCIINATSGTVTSSAPFVTIFLGDDNGAGLTTSFSPPVTSFAFSVTDFRPFGQITSFSQVSGSITLSDSTQFTFGCSRSSGSVSVLCSDPDLIDGRLNSVCLDAAQAAALYCNADATGMVVLLVRLSTGSFAFRVSQQDLDQFPAKPRVNTLIKQGGGIRLWRLTTGELQFDAPNGEVYTFGLPLDGPVTFKQICTHQVRWYHPPYFVR